MTRYAWFHPAALGLLLGALFVQPVEAGRIDPRAAGNGWTLVGWNDLGMHCMDSDYSVFSILPPFNTIHAHLIDASGKLVRDASAITMTYEGVADPSGSVNTTSQGKTNFWQYVLALYGAGVAPDAGLPVPGPNGFNMPGPSNEPQTMIFDQALNWFTASGIPLTPYDDAGIRNTYPMMRLTARRPDGSMLATTDIVLPVSDEMDCRACHSSGSADAAQPAAGWVNDSNPERDYRLNILLRHDDLEAGADSFQAALAQKGYNSAGLYATVTLDGKPVLCAACHASNALPGTGVEGIRPLTQAMHGFHAVVNDPATDTALDASDNRSACYRCHPGSTTQCLRGAMGRSISPDGSVTMQCQSCHGSMSTVGSSARQGWLEEPACQNCHTGTALSNRGQIRYTSVFEDSGSPRAPADTTFATNPDVPAQGLSLYRFSQGHGGLQCEACHGSTHAEYASSHANDNLQSIRLQGFPGMLSDCTVCHNNAVPNTTNGGPHGLHPIGQSWISGHQRAARGTNRAQCQACHGIDYRGTVLSSARGNRTINAGEFGIRNFLAETPIGCYSCHNGPNP